MVDNRRGSRDGARIGSTGARRLGDSLVGMGPRYRSPLKTLGASRNLLTVKLDVTRPADAEAAVKAVVHVLAESTC